MYILKRISHMSADSREICTMFYYVFSPNATKTWNHRQFYASKRSSSVFVNKWLVGRFRLSVSLRQYVSLYRAIFHKNGEGKEKNIKTPPSAPTASTVGPYYYPN